MVDELVRRMTQLDPALRPSAEYVARELAVLAEEEKATPGPPDPARALDRLKAALVSHFSQTEHRNYQQSLADKTAARIAASILSVQQEIMRRTGLSCSSSFSARLLGATS